MAADWRDFSGYNPFWNSSWTADGHGVGNNDGNGEAAAALCVLPAGITAPTTAPTHPHASTLAERVLRFDLNSATHQMRIDNHSGSAWSAPPDQTKRWGIMASFLLYVDSTKVPASDWKIAGALTTSLEGGSGDQWRIVCTSAGLIKLYTDNGVLAATSTTAITLDAWQQLELWHIFNDSAGNALATDQWVVRKSSAATGAVSWTTLINVNFNNTLGDTTAMAAFGNFWVGGTATYGAGKEMNLANVCSGWQDADAALGINRLDFMDPSGQSAGTNMDTWTTHVFTNVDEASVAQGQGNPDDVTTKDENAISLLTTRDQLYTMTSPTYVTGSDIVIGVRNCQRLDFFAVGKGGSARLIPVLGDGTTLRLANNADALASSDAGVYATRIHTERLNPGGTAYSVSDMASVEAGCRDDNLVAASVTARNSTCTAVIIYQKASETGTAVDARNIAVGKLVELNQSVNRAGTY